MTESILIATGFFLLGVLLFPLLMFLRARRDGSWDDSNMLNMYRVVAHLTVRPGDFGKMFYEDGRRPFWYINKDEFSEVVKSSHQQKDKNNE
jgi:hypothetical protein